MGVASRAGWSLGVVVGAVAWGCATSAGLNDRGYDDAGAAPAADASAPSAPADGGQARAVDAGTGDASDVAPLPVLDSVTPDHAVAGTAGPELLVHGAGFVSTSVVQVDGAPLVTTYYGPGELHATVPSSKLTTAGTLKIAVGTAPPGGGLSAEIAFTVGNPQPLLTQLSPQSAESGAPATQLTVTGGHFVTGAVVTFDGADLTTTYTSENGLSATIPASMLGQAGSHAVTVDNPAPGGGASTSIAFIVTNPTVTVTSATPATAVLGAAATPVSLTGTGFIMASAVSFNGASVASSFVDGAHLSATIPASLLGTTGTFPIVVTNPEPGGGVSTPVTFQVQNPAPSVASLAPSMAAMGAGPTAVIVTGSGFVASSQVTLDGAPTSTTYVDGTHLQATLSAAQLAATRTIAVAVVTPAPGGGTSNAVKFTVANAAPVVTSLAPPSAVVLAPGATITISGSGFVSGATASANGAALVTTFTSATQLGATIPASMLTQVGALAITVTNPAPTVGASNAVNFAVTCDPTGVDVQLGSTAKVTRDLLWGSSPPTSERLSTSGACPASIPSTATDTEPYRAYVVQNATSGNVTLSTWAVCPATSTNVYDAFLAVYRTGTVPTARTDRLACTGYVSEGEYGNPYPSGLPSPDANGSSYCPGLTAANGGGMTLGVCEKAVVYVQPYSITSTSYVPPPQLSFQAQ